MTSRTLFDYATPYDIMVGRWSGMTMTFDADGEYLNSVASLVNIFWRKPYTLLHYEQDELPDLDARLGDNPHKEAIAKIVRHDFDLKIDGKSCKSTNSRGEDIRVVGAETSPGIYIFHIAFPEGHYYNNQFFTSPNERHIIGPFIEAGSTPRAISRRSRPAKPPGDVTFVVAQTFTRISYEVPAKYMRHVPRTP